MNKDVQKTLVTSVGVTGGTMIGKIASVKIPFGSKMVKRGAVLATALAGIYFLDRKTDTKAFGQDVCVGVAVSQITGLTADLLGDKAKSLGLAGVDYDENDIIFLGNPTYEDDFLSGLDGNYEVETYDAEPAQVGAELI